MTGDRCSGARASVLAAALVLCSSTLPAQSVVRVGFAPALSDSQPAAVARFVERARAGTARYRDQRVARDDGYRRIGPDFPGMGEHWVQVGVLLSGRLDAETPSVLSYTTIDGRPELVGVAYALALPDESPLPASPAPVTAWHEHGGSVDEESFLLEHGSAGAGTTQGVRLVVMHAWVWRPNPHGLFATDNWTLPFLRSALTASAAPSSGAARALSLAGAGEAFHRRLFVAASGAGSDADARIAAVLAGQRSRVTALLAAAGDTLDDARLGELEAIWRATWEAIDRSVSPDAAARLRLLRHRLDAEHPDD